MANKKLVWFNTPAKKQKFKKSKKKEGINEIVLKRILADFLLNLLIGPSKTLISHAELSACKEVIMQGAPKEANWNTLGFVKWNRFYQLYFSGSIYRYPPLGCFESNLWSQCSLLFPPKLQYVNSAAIIFDIMEVQNSVLSSGWN